MYDLKLLTIVQLTKQSESEFHLSTTLLPKTDILMMSSLHLLMRVAKVQVGILRIEVRAKQVGKVRDGRICESPTERLKSAA